MKNVFHRKVNILGNSARNKRRMVTVVFIKPRVVEESAIPFLRYTQYMSALKYPSYDGSSASK